jgi:hypothetical protein
MVKREDLVKQFDLIVKQEIKNHNDQIFASNQSINKIREDLEKVDSKQAQINSSLASEISKLNANSLELSNLLGNLVGRLASSTNDLKTLIGDLQSQMVLVTKQAVDCKAALQVMEKSSKAADIRMSFLEESIKNIPEILQSFSERVERKAMTHACKAKEEILALPSEAKLVKEELSKLMERDRIDFEGVTKELISVKKAHFINDKKIEHIYTLIERLTKKLEAK